MAHSSLNSTLERDSSSGNFSNSAWHAVNRFSKSESKSSFVKLGRYGFRSKSFLMWSCRVVRGSPNSDARFLIDFCGERSTEEAASAQDSLRNILRPLLSRSNIDPNSNARFSQSSNVTLQDNRFNEKNGTANCGLAQLMVSSHIYVVAKATVLLSSTS